MPAPMHVYRDIAARHGVDPKDEAAIDSFFLHTVPTLDPAKQLDILDELLMREAERIPPGESK